jgi:hypothetical protein
MNLHEQEELRNKYSAIRRGFLAMMNHIEGLVTLRTTGEPFFDDDEEARKKLLAVVAKAAQMAAHSEIEALVAEYGPEARHVLS